MTKSADASIIADIIGCGFTDQTDPSRARLASLVLSALRDRECVFDDRDGHAYVLPTSPETHVELSPIWARPEAWLLSETVNPGSRLWVVPLRQPKSKGDVQRCGVTWTQAHAKLSFDGRLILSDADVILGAFDRATLLRHPFDDDGTPLVRVITGSMQLLGTMSGPFATLRDSLPPAGLYQGWGFEDTHTYLAAADLGAVLCRYSRRDTLIVDHSPHARSWPVTGEQSDAVRLNGKALGAYFGHESFRSPMGREVLAMFREAHVHLL